MSLLSQFGRHHFRTLTLARSTVFSGRVAPKSTGTAQEQMDEFWGKNKSLKRPMSPHMTVYNMTEVTSALSLTHRGTGILLCAGMTGLAFVTPFLSSNFDQTVLSLQTYADSMITYALLMDFKFVIVFSFVFHTLNGVRHLAWDMGKGFEMDALKKTGYGTLILSLIVSVLITFFYKEKTS